MIPYARQDISQADIDAVCSVLRSDFLTQGESVPAFEKAVAHKVGATHAVAVNSGTSALHLACMALGLGEGDVLWTSPISFVASANCARYCGAHVDFVDIDPRTYLMCPKALEAKLLCAKKLPKIVVSVHFAGQPCDMAAISALAERFGFYIIEDASHAIGAAFAGDSVGNCSHSDITVFSFHPVKIITSGEGGMALTNNPTLAASMKRLRTHGITRDPDEMSEPAHGAWYYQQLDLGYNYRLTDIQAALGLSQLARLDNFIARRRTIAARYDAALASLPLTLPFQQPEAQSAWHLYVIRVQDASQHRAMFDGLRAAGIGVNLHYIPIHLQPYYRKLGFTEGDFPEAETYYREALSLPMYAALTENQQDAVVSALKSLL